MDRLKKLNGSMIAAIVLSVLLIMSITTGATLAWFASRDSATNSLTMGEAVVVTIGEDYKQGDGELAMNLPVDKTTNGLLPGMSVTPNIKVQLQKSNTNALLRARFITTVEYPDKYMDEAYSNTKKYENDTAVSDSNTYEGRVLTNEATTVFKSVGGVKPEYTDGKITNYSATGTEYVDAYGAKVYITSADLANSTGYSKVYKYNVFAGYMIYDYYNYLGQRYHNDMTSLVTEKESDAAVAVKTDPYSEANIAATKAAHTKIIHLNRVEVRDEIANKIGADDNKIAINGVEVAVTEKNAAELEIRQRCVDLTNAINRVLQGQRGYGIDPTTGKVVEDSTNGVKYTRRVADGWAYRDADQAWYYLGSQTNGYVITDNSTGKSETVDNTKPIAKDITKYSDVGAGNLTVRQPSYELLSSATNQYQSTVTTQGSGDNAIKNDMTRNYLGGSSKDDSIDRVRNEIGVLNQETISSIDLSQGDVSIDFLTKRFVLPRFINNDYAKAKVTFTFTVEAVQDYLIDPLQEATAAADRIPNNLVNAILVFNNAFPQTLFPKSTDDNDLLRATGSTANVIPGGGESVKWNNSAEGSTTVTYRGVETQGDTFSYGYIDGGTLGGKEYSWTEGQETKTAKVSIKGYAVKIDEYGAYVADYKNAATYVRGTASSIGVGPYVTTTSPKTGA